MKVFIIAYIIVYLISPLFRCISKNILWCILYSGIDFYTYIKYKKWEAFNEFGIDCFCGMFGHGKSLSMCHRARYLYKKYGDRIRFISNIDLKSIPYIPLTNFQQIVDLAEEAQNDPDPKYEGTVVLIDEIENVLNNRNYAKFPLSMLHTINQQRKAHVYIMTTSPRFFMIDKLFRSITTRVYMCDKYWRFQHIQGFDAWDLENAMNTRDIKRIANVWYFVKNQDYRAYDTSQIISKDSAEKFISNEETLSRLGDANVNTEAVTNRSKSYRRRQSPRKNNKH